MTCSSFLDVEIKLWGKSAYKVPATPSKTDTSLIPDFLFGERLEGCIWGRNWLRPICNDDYYSACAQQSHDRKTISGLSPNSTEVSRNPPILRQLIPSYTADKFWCFSSVSETHSTHRGPVKGLQGYSLSFGISQLFCSTVREQFSSWLVAVWGKKCLF